MKSIIWIMHCYSYSPHFSNIDAPLIKLIHRSSHDVLDSRKFDKNSITATVNQWNKYVSCEHKSTSRMKYYGPGVCLCNSSIISNHIDINNSPVIRSAVPEFYKYSQAIDHTVQFSTEFMEFFCEIYVSKLVCVSAVFVLPEARGYSLHTVPSTKRWNVTRPVSSTSPTIFLSRVGSHFSCHVRRYPAIVA